MDLGQRLNLLRAMGQAQGRQTIRSEPLDIQPLVGGTWVEQARGSFLKRELKFPLHHSQGRVQIRSVMNVSPDTLTLLAGDPALSQVAAKDLVFIDTETTGLAGGTGTHVFLVGLGRMEGEFFCVTQFFLPGPRHEYAFLEVLRDMLSTAPGFGSFNGKRFDMQLLQTRFILKGVGVDLGAPAHLDLLYPSRKVWRNSLEDCRLTTIERAVLGLDRYEDIESALIPSVYFAYLRGEEPSLMKAVFEHNLRDVLSLTSLTGLLGEIVGSGRWDYLRNAVEHANLVRLYLSRGDWQRAKMALERATEMGLEENDETQLTYSLSLRYKREGLWEDAVRLWERLLRAPLDNWLGPYVELAKYFEWRAADLARAREYVVRALRRLELGEEVVEAEDARQDLFHRLGRIEAKLTRKQQSVG